MINQYVDVACGGAAAAEAVETASAGQNVCVFVCLCAPYQHAQVKRCLVFCTRSGGGLRVWPLWSFVLDTTGRSVRVL